MWTWPRAVDKWIDIELAREEEVDGRTYPSALRSSPVPPCLASLSPHRSPASPPSSSRPPQASDECIKLIVDSFPFHSLHSRRHTLGLAWCRSGTDQSGFRQPTPYPVRPPPRFGWLASPLASSEFENTWRKRKVRDWIRVFPRSVTILWFFLGLSTKGGLYGDFSTAVDILDYIQQACLLGHIQSKNKLSLLLSADSIYKHRARALRREWSVEIQCQVQRIYGESDLAAEELRESGVGLSLAKDGGSFGSGSGICSLFSITTTDDMVGRSSGFSCTHSNPTWKQRLASFVG
ncbi:hypothetical protein BHM03_00038704 [Ensete ventricosum]|nr:hypothetical protein BHM03_00038704 [Ensete ventricosum]